MTRRLKYTRAILDAIHSGELAKAEYETYETFNLHVPMSANGVPSELLNPAKSWTAGLEDFKGEVKKLATLFVDNFKKYEDEATPDVIGAGSYRFKVAPLLSLFRAACLPACSSGHRVRKARIQRGATRTLVQ